MYKTRSGDLDKGISVVRSMGISCDPSLLTLFLNGKLDYSNPCPS